MCALTTDLKVLLDQCPNLQFLRHMCMSVPVRVHACLHVLCQCACVHACMHVLCQCVCVCLLVCMYYANVGVCMHTCVYCANVCVCVCARAYLYELCQCVCAHACVRAHMCACECTMLVCVCLASSNEICVCMASSNNISQQPDNNVFSHFCLQRCSQSVHVLISYLAKLMFLLLATTSPSVQFVIIRSSIHAFHRVNKHHFADHHCVLHLVTCELILTNAQTNHKSEKPL